MSVFISILLISLYLAFSIFLLDTIGFRFSLLIALPTFFIYSVLPLTLDSYEFNISDYNYLLVNFIIALFFLPSLIYSTLWDKNKWKYLRTISLQVDYSNYRKILYNKYIFSVFIFLISIYLIGMQIDVGLTNTGFFAFITDPSLVDVYRENSAKLLTLPGLLRLQSILTSILIPLYISLSIFSLNTNLISLRRVSIKNIFQVFFIFVLSLVYLIPGYRSGIANLIFICIIPLYLRSRSTINSVIFTIFGFFISFLSVAFFISVKTNYSIFNFEKVISTVFYRIALTPLKVSSWWLEYVDRYGFSGFQGIHKFAILFRLDYIDLPNTIGLINIPSAFESVSAVTNPAITLYTYFGYYGVILGGIFLVFLERLALQAIFNCHYPFQMPALVILSIVSIKAVESDLLTTLFTHGYVLLIILCLFFTRFFNKENRRII